MDNQTISLKIGPSAAEFDKAVKRLQETARQLSANGGFGSSIAARGGFKALAAALSKPRSLFDLETVERKPEEIEIKVKPSKLLLSLIDRLEKQ